MMHGGLQTRHMVVWDDAMAMIYLLFCVFCVLKVFVCVFCVLKAFFCVFLCVERSPFVSRVVVSLPPLGSVARWDG